MPLFTFAIFPCASAKGRPIIWNTLKCRREKQAHSGSLLLLLAGAHAIFISFFPPPPPLPAAAIIMCATFLLRVE